MEYFQIDSRVLGSYHQGVFQFHAWSISISIFINIIWNNYFYFSTFIFVFTYYIIVSSSSRKCFFQINVNFFLKSIVLEEFLWCCGASFQTLLSKINRNLLNAMNCLFYYFLYSWQNVFWEWKYLKIYIRPTVVNYLAEFRV